MVDTYESLNQRFPILDVVIKYLNCATEKALLKELFVTVYGVGLQRRTNPSCRLAHGSTRFRSQIDVARAVFRIDCSAMSQFFVQHDALPRVPSAQRIPNYLLGRFFRSDLGLSPHSSRAAEFPAFRA
jgi:hypothetical protein